MDKDLRLDRCVLRDELYLLKAQLAREHGAGHAHLRRGLDPGEVMDAHLRACVQRDIRQRLTYRIGKAEILNNDPVRAELRCKARALHSLRDLTVVDQGIERDIHLAAADAAIAHRALELLIREVLRAAAGVEVAKPHIYSVRTVLHGGDNGLRRTRG